MNSRPIVQKDGYLRSLQEEIFIEMRANFQPLTEFLGELLSLLTNCSDVSRKFIYEFIDGLIISGKLFSLVSERSTTGGTNDLVIFVLPSKFGLELIAALRAGNVDEFMFNFKSHD